MIWIAIISGIAIVFLVVLSLCMAAAQGDRIMQDFPVRDRSQSGTAGRARRPRRGRGSNRKRK